VVSHLVNSVDTALAGLGGENGVRALYILIVDPFAVSNVLSEVFYIS
jgi:hypothetical protein